MNKLLKLTFLLVFFSLCFAIADADAQNYGKKKKKKKKKPAKTERTDEYFDDRGSFASRLWFGGGFNLGFTGNNVRNAFSVGLSPMVGYKIIDQISVGPTVGIQYNYVKGTGIDNRIHKTGTLSWSAGVFARYKFVPLFFIHGEYGLDNNEYYYTSGGYLAIDPITRDVVTSREQQSKALLGVGYTSGGDLVAVEIYILYNFIEPPQETIDLPIVYRFGITYKF